MNNPAAFFVLLFLAITFIQSACDKIFDWNSNINWLKSHFKNTILKNQVPLALKIVVIFEIISGIFSILGCIEELMNQDSFFGFYGSVFSCLTLLMLLIGQRLAKEYDGARTIVIYFIPAVLSVYWLH